LAVPHSPGGRPPLDALHARLRPTRAAGADGTGVGDPAADVRRDRSPREHQLGVRARRAAAAAIASAGLSRPGPRPLPPDRLRAPARPAPLELRLTRATAWWGAISGPLARDRGAPRVSRGAPSVGGWGGPFRGRSRVIEERHGFPRGAPSVGGCGGPFRGPPRSTGNVPDGVGRGAVGTDTQRRKAPSCARPRRGAGDHDAAPHRDRPPPAPPLPPSTPPAPPPPPLTPPPSARSRNTVSTRAA